MLSGALRPIAFVASIFLVSISLGESLKVFSGDTTRLSTVSRFSVSPPSTADETVADTRYGSSSSSNVEAKENIGLRRLWAPQIFSRDAATDVVTSEKVEEVQPEGRKEPLRLIPKSPGRPPVEPEPSSEIEEDSEEVETPLHPNQGESDVKFSYELDKDTPTQPQKHGNFASLLQSLFGPPREPEGTGEIEFINNSEAGPASTGSDINEGGIGPVLIEESAPIFGEEELEMQISPEPSADPLNEMEQHDDFTSAILEEESPEPSPLYPEFSPLYPEPSPMYPEPSLLHPEPSPLHPTPSNEHDAYPSAEPHDLTLTLLVQHPVQLIPEIIATGISKIADEMLPPDASWKVETIIPKPGYQKSASSDKSAENTKAGEIIFELGMYASCAPEQEDSCALGKEVLMDFIRDESMDKNLAANDLNHVHVYVKGDTIVDRSGSYQAATPSGISVGVIAGIAVGGVAIVSLIVLGVIMAAKRSSESSDYDAELGHMGGFDDDDNYSRASSALPQEEGSFLISNFGGTPRNTSGMIPWMNVSQGRHGANLNSSSFISVDTMGEMTSHRLPQYTDSSSTGSFEDLKVDDDFDAPNL